MTCERIQPLLSAYLDGETPGTERAEIAEHLGACAPCRSEAQAVGNIAQMARALPRHTPSQEAVLKISEAIHQLPPRPRRTEFGPVMDFDELADYLRVDRSTLGTYLDEIPSFELGGKVLFRQKSVEEWIRHKETRLSWQPRKLPPDAATVPETATGGASWQLSDRN
jgi:hypothetical protein